MQREYWELNVKKVFKQMHKQEEHELKQDKHKLNWSQTKLLLAEQNS